MKKASFGRHSASWKKDVKIPITPYRLTQKAHRCRYCKKHTDYFVTVKRKIYSVKLWECEPICSQGEAFRFMVKDTERRVKQIYEHLATVSPFLDIASK